MNTIAKVKWSLITAILMLIPTEAYCLARFILSPEGFWQEVILLGIGVWVLGILQVLFVVVFAVVLYTIWYWDW